MRYRFRPSLIPTLATLVLLPLLVSLGFWQLDRAEQKRALQAEYDARSLDEQVLIGASAQSSEDLRFYKVVARGHYDTEYQILLDNRVHHGQPGYYVITPLKLQGSDVRVLVNRGWVPLGESRARLPTIPTPKAEQEIEGVATVPLERRFSLGGEARRGQWQAVWPYLDLARYADAVPFPIQPVVVLLDPASPAGGFVREWARLDTGIATHQGYAFQWFTLALALATIYLFVNLEKRPAAR
jgi:surfeit locus 1 family protein